MGTKYTREQILRFSNEDFLKLTKGKAVDFHLTDGRCTQLCVNDLLGFDSAGDYFYTRTGIHIGFYDIDYVEVFFELMT